LIHELQDVSFTFAAFSPSLIGGCMFKVSLQELVRSGEMNTDVFNKKRHEGGGRREEGDAKISRKAELPNSKFQYRDRHKVQRLSLIYLCNPSTCFSGEPVDETSYLSFEDEK